MKAEGEGYTRYYDFEDKQPVFGRQYYRLRMVEVDQRFSFRRLNLLIDNQPGLFV